VTEGSLAVRSKTIKEITMEKILEMENIRKRSGVIDESITNRIQEMEEIISDIEDSIENFDATIKENAKCKMLLTQNVQNMHSVKLQLH
jgi:predicted ribosome quality control (RQC) complex YloA/Tae2 family protein